MGILGTGIDMIEVERVERALTRPRTGERFRDRVYTEREVAYCESRGRPRYQSYAARFAAKEAAMKAMGTGWNRNVGWREIEVVRERGQAPTIVLSGKAADYRAPQAHHGLPPEHHAYGGERDGACDRRGLNARRSPPARAMRAISSAAPASRAAGSSGTDRALMSNWLKSDSRRL